MINDIVPIATFTADGATTTFAFRFLVLNAADLKVHINLVEAPANTYTVNGVGNTTGGTVVMNTAPANGYAVMLARESPFVRTTTYSENGDLMASELNADFNAIWLAMQETKASNQSAITRPIAGGSWDAQNRSIQNLADGVTEKDAATVGQVKAFNGGAENSMNAAKASETAAAGSASAAGVSAGQAAASATAAAGSATAAANSASAAAASEKNAAGSATAAAGSASAAGTSATAAAGSATTAGQQADRAKTEADRAQTANPDNQLKKANNLSDVPDKQAARFSLGLGSFVQNTTATGMQSPDAHNGFNVDNSGDWGTNDVNGQPIPLALRRGGTGHGNTLNNLVGSLDDISESGLVCANDSNNLGPWPLAPRAEWAFVQTEVHADPQYRSQRLSYFVNGLQYRRQRGTAGWGQWCLDWSDNPISGVQVMQRSADNVAQYLGGKKANGALDWYVGKSNAEDSAGFYKANGAGIELYNDRITQNKQVKSSYNTNVGWAWSHTRAGISFDRVTVQQGAENAGSLISQAMATTGLGFSGFVSYGWKTTGINTWPRPVTAAAVSDAGTDGTYASIAYWEHTPENGDIVSNNPTGVQVFTKAPTSDATLKDDIQDYDGLQSLANIEAIELKTFVYKKDEKRRVRRGAVAQQLQTIDKDYVKRIGVSAESEGVLALDPNPLLMDALAAIKVLSAEVKALKGEKAKSEKTG
jgi:hypothetical protein